MKCIIVDDDKMSITMLQNLVSRIRFLSLVGTCSTAAEALDILKSTNVDLMFLDIEMPDISGLDLIKSIKKPPVTILVSSKKEYAFEAFNCNVVDYLIKPVSMDRFLKGITKAEEALTNSKQLLGDPNKNYAFIKSNKSLIKINIQDILWIEALGDYLTINTSEKKYTIHSTMKTIEKKLPADKYIRVHRSFIISIDNISSIDDSVIVIGKQLIPIGTKYKDNLTKRLNLL